MIDSRPVDEPEDAVTRAIKSEIPHVYCNGFSCVLSNGDVFLVLQTNGQDAATLNLSFTMAKTMSAAIGQAIASLEHETGRDIMTMNDINVAQSKVKEQ